jgi:hypothetical protein
MSINPTQVLAQAVRDVEREHPLPRCSHENALRDHGGEYLEPACGCRMAPVDTARPVSIDLFGKDHWSALAYAECRIVDNKGIPTLSHMRCDPRRHPGLVHRLPFDAIGSKEYPTILAGGALLFSHDDWDCIDDLEAAGLMQIKGTGIHPVWKLTQQGLEIAAKLRAHGSFNSFAWAA